MMADLLTKDEEVARFSKARRWGSTAPELKLMRDLMPICNAALTEKLKAVVQDMGDRVDTLYFRDKTQAGTVEQLVKGIRDLELSQRTSDQTQDTLVRQLERARSVLEALDQRWATLVQQIETMANHSKLLQNTYDDWRKHDATYRAKVQEKLESLDRRTEDLYIDKETLRQHKERNDRSEELLEYLTSSDCRQAFVGLSRKLDDAVLPRKSCPPAKSLNGGHSEPPETTTDASGSAKVYDTTTSQQKLPYDGERFLTLYKSHEAQFMKEPPPHEYDFVRTFLERQTPRVAQALQRGVLAYCPSAQEKDCGKIYGKFKMRLILDRQTLTWNNIRTAYKELGFDALARREAVDMKHYRARKNKRNFRGKVAHHSSRQGSGGQEMSHHQNRSSPHTMTGGGSNELLTRTPSYAPHGSGRWAGEGNSEF